MSRRPAWTLSPILQAIAIGAIVVAGLVVAFLIVPWLMRGRAERTSEAAPAPVASGYFRLSDLEWEGLRFARVGDSAFADIDQTDGSIAAADDTTTQVISAYTGRVTAVYVTVGDTVHAGQPLFTIEGTELAQAENDLTTALETLRSAEIQRHVTAVNRRRLLALKRSGGAALKDIEQSAADLATAETAVRNGAIAVALVRSRLRILGLSDGAIDRLAGTAHASILPARVTVNAPAAGEITQRAVGVGQNVESAASGASGPLLTITGMAHVFFVANVPENAIAAVHAGDPISVQLAAMPDTTFQAHVRYIAPTVDPATHRIFVRAEVANPDGSLKPGMYGTMTISTGPAQRTVAVPEDAVIYEGDTARVWVAGSGKTLALRYIRTGKTVDGVVQVTGGLRAGDRVVTAGSVFIDRALRGDQ